MPQSRLSHVLILTAAYALLTLPNLGGPSFFDVDEGVNAEAGREMFVGGDYVVPSFNYQMRTAKPVMLYWWQAASYSVFGVNEFAARFPSALAGWLTVLLVYALGRSMFGGETGLIAGVALASCLEFSLLAHAATPDSLLLMFTVLAMYTFWAGVRGGSRAWWIPTAAACGLAVLTKGPVGVALPGLVFFCYFAWTRQLSRLWSKRLIPAFWTFFAVAGPWYILVTVVTKGQWVKAFIGVDNVGRFLAPMEHHSGPPFYHAVAMFVLFMPWSIFLVATVWYGVRKARACSDQDNPMKLLVCWLGAYHLFFSISATKLPNYALPAYPAAALLTAYFLAGWRRGDVRVGHTVMAISATGLLLVGVGTAGGMVAAGSMGLNGITKWWPLGLIPVAATAVAFWFYRRGQRGGVVATLGVSSVAFIAAVMAFAVPALDEHKSPESLVAAADLHRPDEEIRLAAWEYFQPSLVYYARREVRRLANGQEVADFLLTRRPGYVMVPAKIWDAHKPDVPHEVVARHYDLYKRGDILVVWNGR